MLTFFIGVPLLCVGFGPFPYGCGLGYPILDRLRGHPDEPHGTQPPSFVGLWVHDQPIPFDFQGQAFYLLPDGRVAGMQGMTVRRWHFDKDRFFVDSVSRCGNCYRGNVTAEYNVAFKGPSEIFVTNRDVSVTRGIRGTYHKVTITDSLRSDLNRRKDSKNESESFKARHVLRVIEHFESMRTAN